MPVDLLDTVRSPLAVEMMALHQPA
jgi:hypothetical protein